MRIQHNEGTSECQYNVSVLLDGKKHSSISGEEEAVFPTTPNLTKFSTPPTILRKKKRLRVGQSPVNELNDGLCNDAVNVALKHTPVKTLPFSPSQVGLFLNMAKLWRLQWMDYKLQVLSSLVIHCRLNKYVQKLLKTSA